MAFRLISLFCCVASLCIARAGLGQVPVLPGSTQSQVRSHVQGQGIGEVKLNPTHIRISIPIKIVEETHWDAIQKLRQVRQEVVDRVTEMNAVEDSIRVVGFQCMDATKSTSSFVPAGMAREQPAPQMMAKCYVVADFKMRELEDYEAMIAMSQSSLEELANLIPKITSSRRSYSYSTMSSGLTSQQLDSPLALFYAPITKEDRLKAYQAAFELANNDLESSMVAMGIDDPLSQGKGVYRHSVYSSSRNQHPVDSAIFRDKSSVALSVFPDGIKYSVRLSVSVNFELPGTESKKEESGDDKN